MSEITSPIMLDDTGQDLVAEAQNIVTKLQSLINAVKPTAADIPLAAISGMTADDVQEGVAELKSNLVKYLKINNVITFASGSTGSGYKIYSFSDDDACKGKTILLVHAITSSVSGSATMVTDDRYFDSNTYGMVYSISSALPSEVKYSLVVAYI